MVFYGRILSFLAVIDPNSFDLVLAKKGSEITLCMVPCIMDLQNSNNHCSLTMKQDTSCCQNDSETINQPKDQRDLKVWFGTLLK